MKVPNSDSFVIGGTHDVGVVSMNIVNNLAVAFQCSDASPTKNIEIF